MTDARPDGEIDRTRVGHTKADETDVYAGRSRGGWSMKNREIGARGWLGNPHAMEDGYSRREAIDLFRDDFEARLRGDEEFREAVRDLAGKTLGCWCQRLDEDEPACHAEVIAEWADKLARDEAPELVTDGGRVQDADGVSQVGLSSWSRLQVAEPADRTHGDRSIRCPDCGHTVSDTHGGQPLPDDVDFERTFGWRCSDCHNVFPSRAFNPEADTFNEKYRGAEVGFRDGSSRFIPVPADEVDR